jgi:hypothetical protein
MAKEAKEVGISFTDIHINLKDQTIILKKEEVVAMLVFEGKLPAEGVIFFPSQPQTLPAGPEAIAQGAGDMSPASTSDAAKERKNHNPFSQTQEPAQAW